MPRSVGDEVLAVVDLFHRILLWAGAGPALVVTHAEGMNKPPPSSESEEGGVASVAHCADVGQPCQRLPSRRRWPATYL